MPAPGSLLCTVLLMAAFVRDTCNGETSGRVVLNSPDHNAGSGKAGSPKTFPSNLPHYDLVVAVLVNGGESQIAQDEIASARDAYARYSEGIIYPSENSAPLTLKVVFIIGSTNMPEKSEVPESGLFIDDFLYVDVPEGYNHLGSKTKAMMGLSEHLRCGIVYPKGHKWYDPEFNEATEGGLECHPLYHQGAFYVLGEILVRHLYRSRDSLKVMSVEDAMVGSWLLGINKVTLHLPGAEHFCPCSMDYTVLPFYHDCKTRDLIENCLQTLGAC